MRWFLLLLVGILSVGCSTTAPTNTTSPTVDVAATVDVAVEATRDVERAVEATLDARPEATPTHTPVPTATLVVMNTLVPTPEPYVAAPGSVERGLGELYDCVASDEIFRDLFLASVSLGDESVDWLFREMLEDRDLFVLGMMQVANEDPAFAVLLSAFSEMEGGSCGPEGADSSPVVEDTLGFWVAAYKGGWEGVVALMEAELEDLEAESERAEASLRKGVPFSLIEKSYEDALGMGVVEADALLGELFDCYGSDPDVREIMDSHVPDGSSDHYFPSVMRDRDMFVLVSRTYARQEDDGAERLVDLDFALEAMCR